MDRRKKGVGEISGALVMSVGEGSGWGMGMLLCLKLMNL